MPDSSGTQIDVYFSQRRLNAWLDVVALAFGIVCIIGMVGAEFITNPIVALIALLLTIGLACFVGASRLPGLWFARDEPEWLLRFLCETLDAEEISPQAGSQ